MIALAVALGVLIAGIVTYVAVVGPAFLGLTARRSRCPVAWVTTLLRE